MSTLFLAAVFASALDPAAAWSDRAGWKAATGMELAGVDGRSADGSVVKARWNAQWLFFEFVCRDRSLVAAGSRDGEDHFKIGDVAEIFVGRAGTPSYLEVHATPAGRKTAYAFRDYRKAVEAPSGVEVRAAESGDGWRALIAIPWTALGSGPGEDRWEFLAGRYDYDKPGGRPVLSSFPAQAGKPDFHDRARYARLELRR